MLDALLQRLSSQAGWSGLVFTLVQWQCQLAQHKLKALQRRVFLALCLWAAAWTLLSLSLLALSAWVVVAYWHEHPLYILAGLGLVHGTLGMALLALSRRQLNRF
ncbi:MAG: hypothetical protein EBV20_08510 [Betaproteobacteria bacterium]|jgi:uncharacterized membrane protein YqjE|nr:hypothetical protein [Betaproteobacteria bacterium]NBP45832.1 hypothetical protein [Betaproteobacteria bacterium]